MKIVKQDPILAHTLKIRCACIFRLWLADCIQIVVAPGGGEFGYPPAVTSGNCSFVRTIDSKER